MYQIRIRNRRFVVESSWIRMDSIRQDSNSKMFGFDELKVRKDSIRQDSNSKMFGFDELKVLKDSRFVKIRLENAMAMIQLQ